MTIVLDSTVLIDFLRARPEAIEFVDSLRERAVSSEMTRVEVRRGIRAEDLVIGEALFRRIMWIAVSAEIATRAGDLGRLWAWGRSRIGAPDLVVAATAERFGGRLATSNVRHFPMFPDLKPPY